VIDRTGGIAEWNATIHATACLHAGLIVAQGHAEFFVMFQSLLRRFAGLAKALKLDKAGDVAHVRSFRRRFVRLRQRAKALPWHDGIRRGEFLRRLACLIPNWRAAPVRERYAYSDNGSQ